MYSTPCLNTTELIISYLKQDILDSMLDSETKQKMSFTFGEMYRWIQYDSLCCCILVVSVLPAVTIPFHILLCPNREKKNICPGSPLKSALILK